MKNIKFAVLAFGLLGLIACFLPLASLGNLTVRFWDSRQAPDGVQTYLVMAGYALGAIAGAIGIAKGFQRPQAIMGTVGFALVLLKFRSILGELLKAEIGGKLLFVAAVGGLVVSIVAAAMPEEPGPTS